MGWFKKMKDSNAKFLELHKFNCSFGGVFIMGDHVESMGKKWSPADCDAEFFTGEQAAKMKAGRVVGGAILAGPIGALIGGMAKQDVSKCYVSFVGPAGAQVLEGPLSDQASALLFVNNLKGAKARALAQREQSDPAPQQTSATPTETALDQLERLGKLRDSGVVSEEEFAAKKAELLGRL